jgi:DNA mismatch repair protein MutS
VIQRAKQVMSQIEKHSKIAVGLRKGVKAKSSPQQKNGEGSPINQQPIEQLNMFQD